MEMGKGKLSYQVLSLYFPVSLGLWRLLSFSFPHDYLPHFAELRCECF